MTATVASARRAADLAATIPRRPKRLIVEAAAAENGVELLRHAFAGPVRGAALGRTTIVLDERLRGFDRQWVFAHELGHIIARRRDLAEPGDELFADSFARHYLLPLDWALVEAAQPARLARRLGIRAWLVAAQLSLLGALPSVLRHGQDVICAACGIRGHDPFCGCAVARQEKACRQLLPQVSDLLRGHDAATAVSQPDVWPLWAEEPCSAS